MIRIKHRDILTKMKKRGRISTTTGETIVPPKLNYNIGRDVLEVISNASHPISTKEIAYILGIKRKSVTKVLTKMFRSKVAMAAIERFEDKTPFKYLPRYSKKVDVNNLYQLILDTRE